MIANYADSKRVKICAGILFALMSSHTGNAAANETIRLVESDSGKTVEIGVSEELEVLLTGKPTAGYVWEISTLDPALLKHSKTEHFNHVKGHRLGKFRTAGFSGDGSWHHSVETDIPQTF